MIVRALPLKSSGRHPYKYPLMQLVVCAKVLILQSVFRTNTMFAVVSIGGQQFKVAKDQYIYVNRLPQAEGEQVSFDQVLLVANGATTQLGAPTVAGAKVNAKVLSHVKGDKVIVYKKKRRKGYQRKNGHRQFLTKIQIESIQA